jgi:hypothetical protein
MAYSQPKHVAVNCINIWNSGVKLKIVCDIETPFFRQGMRSDKFYFMSFCLDLSQTDLTKVQSVLGNVQLVLTKIKLVLGKVQLLLPKVQLVLGKVQLVLGKVQLLLP